MCSLWGARRNAPRHSCSSCCSCSLLCVQVCKNCSFRTISCPSCPRIWTVFSSWSWSLWMGTLLQTLQLKCAVRGHLPSGNTYGEKRHKKAMNLKVGMLRKPPQYTYKAVFLVIATLQNNLQGILCNIKNVLNHCLHQLWQSSTSIADHVKIRYREPSGNTALSIIQKDSRRLSLPSQVTVSRHRTALTTCNRAFLSFLSSGSRMVSVSKTKADPLSQGIAYR